LELDVHLFASDGLLPNGDVKWFNHTLVTLEFEEVEAIELEASRGRRRGARWRPPPRGGHGNRR
jgi:hypothetical protein